MKYLNLDPDFSPFGEGIAFESFTFKGGEPHIKILEALTEEDEVMITCRASSFESFGLMLLAADSLSRFGLNRMELANPAQIISGQINQHQMLSSLFFIN